MLTQEKGAQLLKHFVLWFFFNLIETIIQVTLALTLIMQ